MPSMHRLVALGAASAAVVAAAGKSFYVSKADAHLNFDFGKLGVTREGTPKTKEFKQFVTYDGKKISPWHEVPYSVGEKDGERLLSFICEIPKGTTAKMEVNKEHEYNPVIQDTKKGELRYYKYKPEQGSIVNYGAIAQTWEDPEEITRETGVGGDNDPIDVLQLNSKPCETGSVVRVRVLGVFALIDDDETDWKVLVVDADDTETSGMKDVGDVPEAKKTELIEWFRNYKTAEGKGLNKFGLGERVMDKAFALRVCDDTHAAWRKLRYGTGLVNLIVPESERQAALAAAGKLEALTLSEEELQWVDVLGNGWATPLDGFMTERQYLQSLHYEHLVVEGKMVPMPVPIVKACSDADKARIKGLPEVALKAPDGSVVAVMFNPQVYEHLQEERAGRTFGLTHKGHPYISMIYEAGKWLVGGRIKVLKPVVYGDGMDKYRLTPVQLQDKFASLGADAVFVFQLRNPVHNGHALLMQDTAEKLKAKGFKKPVLWLSPLGGWTKDDDVPLNTRMEQHAAIIKNKIFGDIEVVLAIFPSPMLYAGPREVQWHAQARIQGGATHYIVGRDPAGMKHPGTNEDIYEMWHGQKMLQMTPGLQKMQLLPFTFASYDKKAQKMAFFDPKRKEDFESISGSKMRKMAREGTEPPKGFMDPEGWKILANFYKSQGR